MSTGTADDENMTSLRGSFHAAHFHPISSGDDKLDYGFLNMFRHAGPEDGLTVTEAHKGAFTILIL